MMYVVLDTTMPEGKNQCFEGILFECQQYVFTKGALSFIYEIIEKP